MDRTNALLARASQYLRAGTARPGPSPSSRTRENEDNRIAKPKEAEDEVDAYLKSLTGVDEKPNNNKNPVHPSASLPLPVTNVPLSGRGRSFLKAKESTPPALQNQQPTQKNGTVEIPLQKFSKNEPARSRSISGSSVSSPTPPISPHYRQNKTHFKIQSSEEAIEVNDDDDDEALRDRQMVAEHFRQALKTTSGNTRNTNEQLPKQQSVTEKDVPVGAMSPKKAPPLASTHDSAPIISSSFIDESGNMYYSLTFEEDDEEDNKEASDEKSEPEMLEEEDTDSPVNLLNVVQSVDELLSGQLDFPQSQEPPKMEARPGTAESVPESVESRPESVASIESPKSQVAVVRYSDDFEESSLSRRSADPSPNVPLPVKAEKSGLSTEPPVLNLFSATNTEAHSITTTRIAEESIAAPLSESVTTDMESSRKQRAHSYDSAQHFLELPSGKFKAGTENVVNNSTQENQPPEAPRRENKPKSNITKERDLGAKQTESKYFSPVGAEGPQFQPPQSSMAFPQFYQQLLCGNVPPIVIMMPPQSFFQQYFSHPPTISVQQQVPQAQPTVPAEPDPPRKQQPPTIAQPSIFLPIFLERSKIRSLVAQCRMMTEEINATRIAYERRLANIQQNGPVLK